MVAEYGCLRYSQIVDILRCVCTLRKPSLRLAARSRHLFSSMHPYNCSCAVSFSRSIRCFRCRRRLPASLSTLSSSICSLQPCSKTHSLDVHLDVPDSLGQSTSGTSNGDDPGLDLDLDTLRDGQAFVGSDVLHLDGLEVSDLRWMSEVERSSQKRSRRRANGWFCWCNLSDQRRRSLVPPHHLPQKRLSCHGRR